MVAVYLTKQNKQYTVSNCTTDDIDTHFEHVKDLIGDMPVEEYKTRMSTSIAEDLAYKVMLDDICCGFLYVKKLGRGGEGVSIWGNNSIGFTVLLKEMFEALPFHKVVVEPHTTDIKYIKSLATGTSIRNHHTAGAPLALHVPTLLEKFKGMYIKLGITKL